MKWRGFNQSEVFARALGEKIHISVFSDVAKRTLSNETQTRNSRQNRWKNVADIYAITSPEKIQKKNILIVDDVITTGATIETFGNLLLENGAAKIGFCAMAAAQK